MVVIIDSKAIVCSEAVVEGNVIIGAGCVVHPKAIIKCEEGAGRIVIGSDNIFEENCCIVNKIADDTQEERSMTIGNNNLFGVGCHVEAGAIGNCNAIQCRAKIARGIAMEDNCVVGPTCFVDGKSTVPSYTVVFGRPAQIRTQSTTVEHHMSVHKGMLELLRRQLPGFHRFKTTEAEPTKS